MWRVLLGLAATAVLGFALGVWLALAAAGVDKPSPPVVVTPKPSTARNIERATKTRPTMEDVAVVSVAPEVATHQPELDNLRAAVELKRAGVEVMLSMPDIYDDRVGDQFAWLFALTSSERDRVNAALAATRREALHHEAKLAQARVDESGALVIVVPAYPEKGGELHDARWRELVQILGPERSALFQSLAGEFDELGVRERTLRIARATGGNEAAAYEYSDEHRGPGAQGGSSSGQTSRAGLEQAFGDLVKRHWPASF